MEQEIITYLILVATFGYVGYKVVRIFTAKNETSCGGNCGCSSKKKILKK